MITITLQRETSMLTAYGIKGVDTLCNLGVSDAPSENIRRASHLYGVTGKALMK